jgi:hypothetical protein
MRGSKGVNAILGILVGVVLGITPGGYPVLAAYAAYSMGGSTGAVLAYFVCMSLAAAKEALGAEASGDPLMWALPPNASVETMYMHSGVRAFTALAGVIAFAVLPLQVSPLPASALVLVFAVIIGVGHIRPSSRKRDILEVIAFATMSAAVLMVGPHLGVATPTFPLLAALYLQWRTIEEGIGGEGEGSGLWTEGGYHYVWPNPMSILAGVISTLSCPGLSVASIARLISWGGNATTTAVAVETFIEVYTLGIILRGGYSGKTVIGSLLSGDSVYGWALYVGLAILVLGPILSAMMYPYIAGFDLDRMRIITLATSLAIPLLSGGLIYGSICLAYGALSALLFRPSTKTLAFSAFILFR